MKAERRHELQTNSLALWLRWRGPELAQKYGTQALLVLIVAALAVVLIRWRIEAPKVAAQNAADKLAAAHMFISELNSGLMSRPGDAAQATKLISEAMELSDTPTVRGQGYLALGDYYWALANWPELPAAETQPSLRPELPRDTLLERADDAYSNVLKTQNVPAYLSASARIGLGAVNEQRAFDLARSGKSGSDKLWAAAKDEYETVAKATDVPAALKDEAKWHIERLPSLQQPIWLVPPSATQPTTQSGTRPGTQPAEALPPAPSVAATTQPAPRSATTEPTK